MGENNIMTDRMNTIETAKLLGVGAWKISILRRKYKDFPNAETTISKHGNAPWQVTYNRDEIIQWAMKNSLRALGHPYQQPPNDSKQSNSAKHDCNSDPQQNSQ